MSHLTAARNCTECSNTDGDSNDDAKENSRIVFRSLVSRTLTDTHPSRETIQERQSCIRLPCSGHLSFRKGSHRAIVVLLGHSGHFVWLHNDGHWLALDLSIRIDLTQGPVRILVLRLAALQCQIGSAGGGETCAGLSGRQEAAL